MSWNDIKMSSFYIWQQKSNYEIYQLLFNVSKQTSERQAVGYLCNIPRFNVMYFDSAIKHHSLQLIYNGTIFCRVA